MKLPDWLIRLFVKCNFIKVTPFDSELVNPNSLDIRLGNKFGILSATGKANVFTSSNPNEEEPVFDRRIGVINPLDPETFTTEISERSTFVLQPGHGVIACLLEDITLPSFVCAEIRGKSSLGRLFLDNSTVAGWVDAGWSGVLTIELHNCGTIPIVLFPGMRIGQIVFNLTLPCLHPYGTKKGRYQKQEPGQGSKGI